MMMDFFRHYNFKIIDTIMVYRYIPYSASVCIYGTGGRGDFLFQALSILRPDVKIKYFIDSIPTNTTKHEISIVSPQEIIGNLDIDIILICSYQSCEIIGVLKFLGIKNYLIFDPTPRFSEKYFKNKKGKIQKARTLCSNQSDLDLFDLLVDMHRTEGMNQIQSVEFFCNYLDSMQLRGQYLDYINERNIQTIFDCGSFNADSVIKFIQHLKYIDKIHCFDISYSYDDIISIRPDLSNDKRIAWSKIGLSNKTKKMCIDTSSCYEASYRLTENGTCQICCTTIDDYVKNNNIHKVDYIKMDIEGSEYNALKGCAQTINIHRPQLAISSYHSNDDFWRIPLAMNNLCHDYIFRIGHYAKHLQETVWYGIPKELYGGN